MKIEFQAEYRAQYTNIDGLIILNIAIPRRVSRAVAEIVTRNPEKLQVTIGDKHKPRSTGKYSQCNKLNGDIQFFCHETGNDFDDVKDLVKARALKWGYPLKRNKKTGEILLSLKTGEPIPASEADASSKEASYLITEMGILAAEEGITLPAGGENIFW